MGMTSQSHRCLSNSLFPLIESMFANVVAEMMKFFLWCSDVFFFISSEVINITARFKQEIMKTISSLIGPMMMTSHLAPPIVTMATHIDTMEAS